MPPAFLSLHVRLAATALGSLEAKPRANGESMNQQVPATEGYWMTPSKCCLGDHLLQIDCCCCCHVQLFATPWAVACQAPLSMGILQARILEWVVILSSRGSS